LKSPNRAHHVQLLKFIHQTIVSLSEVQDHFLEDEDIAAGLFKDARSSQQRSISGLLPSPEMALRLFLKAGQAADEMNQEELAYEFIVQALTVYEDSISESKAQFASMTLIMGTIQQITVFGYENLETLITKCTVHCSRLLKRADQCRGLILASHLFWGDESLDRDPSKPVYQDAKRVTECLQRALKIADSVMDKSVSLELFVEVLDRYLWYYENNNEMVIAECTDLIA
jgi:vacuolar protein sorting-associated protein 35